MNSKEWTKVYCWLMDNDKLFDPYGGNFNKNIFIEDMKRRIVTVKGHYLNIRVPATEAIAEKYHLKNYKRGNYQLCILH